MADGGGNRDWEDPLHRRPVIQKTLISEDPLSQKFEQRAGFYLKWPEPEHPLIRTPVNQKARDYFLTNRSSEWRAVAVINLAFTGVMCF